MVALTSYSSTSSLLQGRLPQDGRFEGHPLALQQNSPPQLHHTSIVHFGVCKAVEESIHQPVEYSCNRIAGLTNFCIMLGDFSIKIPVFSPPLPSTANLLIISISCAEFITHTTTH